MKHENEILTIELILHKYQNVEAGIHYYITGNL